ncbi:uncharacterized protein LOC125568304 [Nematostella vectensis]|uniref:uncharacterized protein LOC125568304 n=1 Tax=Nematostella vectensis TaxID=45351 RepID=UPI0020771BAE|nr:uncharacterized protein LOC125568304 [Nematostella vectensis]
MQLNVAPWHVGDIFDDVDDKVYFWSSLFQSITEKDAPMKRMKVRDKDVPFMTSEWEQAIRAKRKATSKFLKNKTPENWENKRAARNEATRQRRIAIKHYWRKQCEHLKEKPREFFKTFKPFLSSKNTTRDNEIHLNDVDGTLVKDQSRVAEILVGYFSTIADGIGGDKAKLSSPDDFMDHPSTIRILDVCSNTTPCRELRPVTEDKVFEKLICSQVAEGFERHFFTNSSAYKKSHSCETTLINLIEGWKKARDNKLSVSILSTDMSKAFDSLHPPLLLSKLKAYGFQENLIALLGSYLSERNNRVRLGRHVSSYKNINRGCPQSSALGPLLWNIFQNDLCYHIDGSLSMYADDHQIYHTGSDLSTVISDLRVSADHALSGTRKLERVQERGLRAVFKDKSSSYANLLERAKLPTLLNRRLQDIVILMYKVHNNLCPPNICGIFNRYSANYNLRQADFSLPRYNTTAYGKHSLRYLGPKLWGKLSVTIRSSPSLNTFKRKIREIDISLLIDDGTKCCSLCKH